MSKKSRPRCVTLGTAILFFTKRKLQRLSFRIAFFEIGIFQIFDFF